MSMASKIILGLSLGFWISAATPALAEDSLPAPALALAGTPLKPVGEGNYTKFGLGIYHAVLWAPGGSWSPDKPYALELRYLRGLSQETLSDSIIDDIRGQNVADAATMTRWTAAIKQMLPAVQDGDIMVGVVPADKKTVLFLNSAQIAKIEDAGLSKAFLNIWLGKDADEELKNGLLGKKTE